MAKASSYRPDIRADGKDKENGVDTEHSIVVVCLWTPTAATTAYQELENDVLNEQNHQKGAEGAIDVDYGVCGNHLKLRCKSWVWAGLQTQNLKWLIKRLNCGAVREGFESLDPEENRE